MYVIIVRETQRHSVNISRTTEANQKKKQKICGFSFVFLLQCVLFFMHFNCFPFMGILHTSDWANTMNRVVAVGSPGSCVHGECGGQMCGQISITGSRVKNTVPVWILFHYFYFFISKSLFFFFLVYFLFFSVKHFVYLQVSFINTIWLEWMN